MSAGRGSPITTYFRVCDGVRVRFADTNADSDTTVLLLAPWPESVWAFRAFGISSRRSAGSSPSRCRDSGTLTSRARSSSPRMLPATSWLA